MHDDADFVTEEHTGEAARERAELVVVMSAKGGCGATLTACNMAADIASDRRTCLIDLDQSKGDVAGYLDLRSGRSLNPLLGHLDVADEVLLHGSVEEHPSGLHVLAQPYDLAELNQMNADEVRRLLGLLRRYYQVVVADVGSRVDVAALAASLVADRVVLLTTPDVPALRNALRVSRLLQQLGVSPEQLKLVVSKRLAGEGLSDADISSHLHLPVVAQLRADPPVCEKADTTGHLVGDIAPRSRLAVDLGNLWDAIHGGAAQEPTVKPGWSFWGSR